MSVAERLRARDVEQIVFDAPNVSLTHVVALGKLARTVGLRTVVPATAYFEMAFRMRRCLERRYRPELVLESLTGEEVGVVVEGLDESKAQEIAARIHTHFPTEELWQAAKRRKMGKRRASSTIDWLTAYCCSFASVVVTTDRGVEFERVSTITPEELRNVLSSMERQVVDRG